MSLFFPPIKPYADSQRFNRASLSMIKSQAGASRFAGAVDLRRSPGRPPVPFSSLPADEIRFGRTANRLFYTGKYDGVNFFTDFNDGASNNESILRFRDVLAFTQENRPVIQRHLTGKGPHGGVTSTATDAVRRFSEAARNVGRRLGTVATGSNGYLPVNTFADTPYGNIDYSGLSLHRQAARPNNEIHIHVTDPGVGNRVNASGQQVHNRSILVTQNHGVIIGPNNGSLGLLVKALERQGDRVKLLPIDLAKVQAFERLRLNDPSFILPNTFHARDAFAVVGAAIAGGIDPEVFADTKRLQTAPPQITINAFASGIAPLPQVGEAPRTFHGFQDRTFGNIKTNLVLPAEAAETLAEQGAIFRVNSPDRRLNGGQGILFPFKTSFQQVDEGKELIYLGSSYSPDPKQRFVELAVNLGDVSQRLGLDRRNAKPFIIERVL